MGSIDYNPKLYWEERGKDYTVSVDTSDELEFLAELIFRYGVYPVKMRVNLNYRECFLEVGSGYGRIYQYLEDKGLLTDNNFDMCDISTSMIEECYKRTGIHPILTDGKTIPFNDNRFDWVISFSVFLHVPPTSLFRFFSEHVRVCKKYFYVATYAGSGDNLSGHCFSHWNAYQRLIQYFNLQIIEQKYFMDGQRINWLLEK